MRYTMAMRRTSPLRLVMAAAALVCMAGLAAAPAKEASMSTSDIPSAIVAERGRAIVEHLAGTIGPRSLAHADSLDQAALYIEERFAKLGYTVERQPYDLPGDRPVRNLIVEKAGRDKPEEIILVGAGEPSDDGSGVEEVGASNPVASAGAAPSTCPWCKEELPEREGIKFCPFCGSNLGLAPCTACGEEIDSRWRFCIACGTEAPS